jgi:DeoR/GlpR family transcriptional regulator of sugar metabolism
LPGLRQNQLVALVDERRQMTVAELVAQFGVSRDTIRRDLNALEQRGLLVRTHGGAIAADSRVTREITLVQRMDAQADAKMRIARAAIALIHDGETIIINGGSTTYYFAMALSEHRQLTVVTNNLRIPPAIPERTVRAIYVLGGTYWGNAQVTIGPIGFTAAARINADTAVIGVTGISLQGFSIGRLEEAAVSSDMIKVAQRTIIVADHSKFQAPAFAQVAGFDDVEHFVTDVPPPPDISAALERAGCQIVIAPPPPEGAVG